MLYRILATHAGSRRYFIVACEQADALNVLLAARAKWLSLTSQPSLIAEGADAARAKDERYYGSERQIEALNRFFSSVQFYLDEKRWDQLQAYSLKGTNDENIEEAIRLMNEQHAEEGDDSADWEMVTPVTLVHHKGRASRFLMSLQPYRGEGATFGVEAHMSLGSYAPKPHTTKEAALAH